MTIETLADFGKYIRKCREDKNLTLDAVAALTGISKPYLSNIETARAPGPASEEKLRKIASALDLEADDLVATADWLRTPESVRNLLRDGKLRRGDKALGAQPAAGDTRDPLELVQVPVINSVAAGSAKEFTDLDYPPGVADDYVALPQGEGAQALGKSSFAVRVSGDSMSPEYQEGDLVVVRAGNVESGDDCLVRLGAADSYAQTFKRVYFSSDGQEIRLVPLNKRHAERVVKSEEVTGIYPVVYKVVMVQRAKQKSNHRTKTKKSSDIFLDNSPSNVVKAAPRDAASTTSKIESSDTANGTPRDEVSDVGRAGSGGGAAEQMAERPEQAPQTSTGSGDVVPVRITQGFSLEND